jgi:glutamyl-tRNA synthetase
MRVRFAPSPTGALHIGGARTALYNWLMARGGGGQLVLRIEDTDRERSTPANVAQILDALQWLGLNWDEGPIFQSERALRHAEVLEQLLRDGHAYRSSATAEDVKAYKERYGADRGFRGEPEDEGAVRLRVPDEGETVVDDVVRGPIRFAHAHLDDPVIARADGSALYNFAVAVDDLDAQITDVVRGEDHISNTPKQVLVMRALGATPPRYAHLPLLHGPDGKKLSKRHGAASVQELRDAGYLPEAVRSYIALLGWGTEEERVMTLEELAGEFDITRVNRNPAQFDENKLRWLNGRLLRALPLDELTARLEAFTGRTGLGGAAEIAQEKIQTLADFWPLCGFLFEEPEGDPAVFERVLGANGGTSRLDEAREALERVGTWDVENLERALREAVERLGVRPKDVFQPVRVAIAGSTVSPGIFESLALLGREESLRRIGAALSRAGA